MAQVLQLMQSVPLQLHVHASMNKTCRFIVFVWKRSSDATWRNLCTIFWSKTIALDYFLEYFLVFYFKWDPCGRPLTVVDTSSDNLFHCLNLSPVQLFGHCSLCHAAAANHTSLWSDTNETQQTTGHDRYVNLLLCGLHEDTPPHSKPTVQSLYNTVQSWLHALHSSWNCPSARWRTQANRAYRTTLSIRKSAGMIILLVTGPYSPVRCFDINIKTEENLERSGNWNKQPTWSAQRAVTNTWRRSMMNFYYHHTCSFLSQTLCI